jgi:hypothetical protein
LKISISLVFGAFLAPLFRFFAALRSLQDLHLIRQFRLMRGPLPPKTPKPVKKKLAFGFLSPARTQSMVTKGVKKCQKVPNTPSKGYSLRFTKTPKK